MEGEGEECVRTLGEEEEEEGEVRVRPAKRPEASDTGEGPPVSPPSPPIISNVSLLASCVDGGSCIEVVASN